MDIFQRIGGALARFMYGRNGWDQLNQALFRGYLVLWAAELLCFFIAAARNFFAVFLMLVILFRAFSRNLSRRRTENQKWVNWYCRVKNRNAGARARHADKEHKYFTCKSCKAICRVPVGKGKIVITCPKCGAQINAKT